MKHERLDILVERYWEGACTDAEEQELKNMVKAGVLPARHAELKAYLDYTDSASDQELLGGAFDQQILLEINRRDSANNGYPMWMKIAAGIILLLGLYGVLRVMEESPTDQPAANHLVMIDDTYEDPEVAFEEVKKALALVGMKMNNGMDHAESLGMFDKAKEEISNDPMHLDKVP